MLDKTRAQKEKLGDPYGNERKLQQTWRNYPLRPQNIFLVGAGAAQRGIGGFATAIAARLLPGSSGKIAGRTKLLRDISSMGDAVPTNSRPPWYGGRDAGVRPLEWMRARIASFPKMPLDE